jgi:hypothetical protein
LTPTAKPYTFTRTFQERLQERLDVQLTEDLRAYILAQLAVGEPHRKIDDHGRYSEYFTFTLEGKLVTIVCDQINHKVLTVILETHRRKQFQ